MSVAVLPRPARAIGVIAEAGLVAQTLTLEEYRGLVTLALLGLESRRASEAGLSPDACVSLWAKLTAEYRQLPEVRP